MADLEDFRSESRSWLEANCPSEMREPVRSEADICWAGRNWTFQSDAQRLWLERMAQRGVRNARVLTLATAANDVLLRIERGGPELRAQALALRLPALGTGFSACAGR